MLSQNSPMNLSVLRRFCAALACVIFLAVGANLILQAALPSTFPKRQMENLPAQAEPVNNISFRVSGTFPAHQRPVAVAAGDFNEDGGAGEFNDLVDLPDSLWEVMEQARKR